MKVILCQFLSQAWDRGSFSILSLITQLYETQTTLGKSGSIRTTLGKLLIGLSSHSWTSSFNLPQPRARKGIKFICISSWLTILRTKSTMIPGVMVIFIWLLNEITVCPEMWSYIILGISVKLCLTEIKYMNQQTKLFSTIWVNLNHWNES